MQKIIIKIGKLALVLTIVLGSLAACEDDPIVEPTQKKDDDCQGSYCQIDTNTGNKEQDRKVALLNVQSTNPQTF
ncbi:hypothetical protein [uncultured Microscilla sp.]|uniref:hypothetical protein n=1 Tax=uncultured Microscilla sp. TaxID=432653 RepID=UPI00261F80F5|nr:hypothetical protein [uncultured Microscilla sp.]